MFPFKLCRSQTDVNRAPIRLGKINRPQTRHSRPLGWFTVAIAATVSLALLAPAAGFAQTLPGQINSPYSQSGQTIPGSVSVPAPTSPNIVPGTIPEGVASPGPGGIYTSAPSSQPGLSPKLNVPYTEVPYAGGQAPAAPTGQANGKEMETGNSGGNTRRPAAGNRPEKPGTTPNAAPDVTTTQPTPAPVTLFDEEAQAQQRSLLTTVLTASVTKIQEYPVDLPTILKLVQRQNLPISHDVLTSRLQNTVFWRSVSDMLPDIQPTYTQSKFNGVLQLFGNQTLVIEQTRITPQLQATWTVYPGGTQILQSLAERRRTRASRIRLEHTVQEQLAAAANDYYQLLAAAVQVENTRISLDEARASLNLSEARLKAGVGTKLAVMQDRSQLAQREQALIVAENTRSQAEQALLNRLDLDPDIALVPRSVVSQPQVLVPLTLSTQDLVMHAALKNPAILAMIQDVKALRAESYGVLTRVVPSVTFQAYVNKTGPEWSALGVSKFAGLTVQSDLLENMGAALPLDFHARRLQMHQRENERRQLIRNVETQVINAYLDSKSSAQSILSGQEQLSAAQEAYRLAVGRYRAGLGINADVLNAATALANARLVLTRAILDFNRAQVNLVQAMGESSPETLVKGVTIKPVPKPAARPGTRPLPATP